jgi:predicted MFS family arabinose efflux permease
MDFLVLISVIPTLIWCNLYVILVFRLLYGFSTGILVNCSNFMIMEMVPQEKQSNFAHVVSLGFNAGFCICLAIGLPLAEMTDEEKA